MTWLDPARAQESAEDRALRDELRGMLALPKAEVPASPTPDLVALAEDLRREATRRRHTPALVQPLRRRPTWMMLAAGLPIVLAVSGMAVYSVQQKRKAEALAAAVKQREAELDRLERSQRETQRRERETGSEAQPAGGKTQESRRKPRELVVPGDSQEIIAPMDTQRVKDRK